MKKILINAILFLLIISLVACEVTPPKDENKKTPENIKMSEEDWNTIFETMSTVSNITFTSVATACLDDGGMGKELARAEVAIAGNITHDIITEGDTIERYYTIEDGISYQFIKQSGVWIKQSGNYSSGPTDQMFFHLSLLKDMYIDMTYNPENKSYVCKNKVKNDPLVGSYTIYETRIKFDGEIISEIYFVIDIFMDSYEPTKCAFTYTFDNYGTTIVTLPTNYTESDSNE